MSRSDFITYLFVQALIAYYQGKHVETDRHLKEALWHLSCTQRFSSELRVS